MLYTTMGLVIREVKTGEADRIIHLLTPKLGVISAVVKNGRRLKNKLFSATSLFCYAEFTLYEGRSMYVVDDAEVRDVFFGVRESIEGMSLAMYFSDIVSTLLPSGDEASELMRLLLNSFFFIAERKKQYKLLKLCFELRCMSLAGYMPNIVACANCAKYEGGGFYFDTIAGTILCEECAQKKGLAINLDEASLRAMRHIVFSDDAKVFAFTLGQQSTEILGKAAQIYTQVCIDKPLKTLDFLNTVL